MRRARAALLAGILATGCGGGYPSEDWSGNYLTRVIASSSDCAGMPLPPPLDPFALNVQQDPDNRATITMSPIVRLAGTFEGDRLEARGVLVQEIPLPDTLSRRVSPADSFDTVGYDLSVEFEGARFRASYEIRTPDLRALVEDAERLRCTHRYELIGGRFEPPSLQDQPWLEELAPAAPESAPADTRARGAPGGSP